VLTDSEHATICVSVQNNRKSHRPFWHVPEWAIFTHPRLTQGCSSFSGD